MTIDELKKIIKNDLRKIKICLDNEEKNKRIYFGNRVYGDYNIYIDDKTFNLIIKLDRGETKKISSDKCKDILYELYEHYSFNIASNYERKHRMLNQDFRIILFDKELKLLKKIDDYYYQVKKKKIDDILINYPYK